jgi:hypothetical protein
MWKSSWGTDSHSISLIIYAFCRIWYFVTLLTITRKLASFLARFSIPHPHATSYSDECVFFIFIVAPCISKIHWVLYTNKCNNCISYISLKLYTLKHFHCSFIFRYHFAYHHQGARIFPGKSNLLKLWIFHYDEWCGSFMYLFIYEGNFNNFNNWL